MKLISYVIPAYNASSCITRCLDSIYNLNQKETDFEVIVIDDHSTDNTVEVVMRYTERHDNLILLQQTENHRQGAARNRGISLAKGDYIAFVDSDDMTDGGVLSALKTARKLDLNMVAMHYRVVYNNGEIKDKTGLPFGGDDVFTGIEMQTKQPFWGTAPWPYLYKASFLKYVNYPFAEDVLYEDSDFVNVHLYNATRVAYSKDCGYYMYRNLSSTTNTVTYKNISDYFLLGTRMLKLYSSLEDKDSIYASSILDGGSYNVWMAFRKMNKLPSRKAVIAVFDRIDEHYDRGSLLMYNKPKYCWNWWTRLCLKNKNLSVLITSLEIMCRKLLKKIN